MQYVLAEVAQALLDEASAPSFVAEDGKLEIRFARGSILTVEAAPDNGLCYVIEKGDG